MREYELLAHVGGNMGRVFKARHTRLGKTVAIKLLPPCWLNHQEMIARFQREMAATGQLEHEHFVQALDAGESGGMQYLVMEFVEGIDLAQLAKLDVPLSVDDACEIARQVALGLDHAHARGLIHRDIKPSNIMLTDDGRVKILDLGIALVQNPSPESHELTMAGQLVGTLNYMAPEQFDDSHRVGTQADIYSLGATLYRLLAGRDALDREQFDSPLKLMRALSVTTPPRLDQLRSEVPVPLAELVAQMLEKVPARRPATGSKVAAMLEPFTGQADLRKLAAAALGPQAAATGERPDISAAQPLATDPSHPRWPARASVPRWPSWAVPVLLVILLAAGSAGLLSSSWWRRSAPAVIAPTMATRELADWIIASGGSIFVETTAGTWEVRNAADLPAVPFDITYVGFVEMRPELAAQLDRLAVLPRLTKIDLFYAAIHGHLEPIFKMRSVAHLGLLGADVMDDDLEPLPNASWMQLLQLNQTRITDRSMPVIGQLPALHWLELEETDITDEGLAALANLQHLEYLNLRHTRIGDDGLRQLTRLRRLTRVHVDGTDVTPEGIAELQAVLPACQVGP